jgi:hypothetical protein
MAQDEIGKALIAEIKKNLLARGYTMASWGRAKGYKEEHVVKYIHYYAAKPQTMPQSPIVYAILTDLYKDTGVNLMKKAS